MKYTNSESRSMRGRVVEEHVEQINWRPYGLPVDRLGGGTDDNSDEADDRERQGNREELGPESSGRTMRTRGEIRRVTVGKKD